MGKNSFYLHMHGWIREEWTGKRQAGGGKGGRERLRASKRENARTSDVVLVMSTGVRMCTIALHVLMFNLLMPPKVIITRVESFLFHLDRACPHHKMKWNFSRILFGLGGFVFISKFHGKLIFVCVGFWFFTSICIQWRFMLMTWFLITNNRTEAINGVNYHSQWACVCVCVGTHIKTISFLYTRSCCFHLVQVSLEIYSSNSKRIINKCKAYFPPYTVHSILSFQTCFSFECRE